MSRSSVRKQVLIEALQDNDTSLTDKQKIVRILKSRGNNLHDVQAPEGSTFLASMPKKFRGGVWLKKGDFVIVEPIAEGNKVKAEIVKILNIHQIKYYKTNNAWPQEFSLDTNDKKKEHGDDLYLNPNRPIRVNSDDTSDSDASSDSDEEENDYECKSSCLCDSDAKKVSEKEHE